MRAVVSLSLLYLVACGSTPQVVELPLGVEHVVGFGKSISLQGPLTLTFSALIEDQRCPTRVTCVWAGNARIRVSAMTSRGTRDLTLNTASQPRAEVFEDYSVELRDLAPLPLDGPMNGATVPLEQAYSATLYVTRVGHPLAARP